MFCYYFKFWTWNLWSLDLILLLFEFLDIILLLVMIVSFIIFALQLYFCIFIFKYLYVSTVFFFLPQGFRCNPLWLPLNCPRIFGFLNIFRYSISITIISSRFGISNKIQPFCLANGPFWLILKNEEKIKSNTLKSKIFIFWSHIVKINFNF